MHSVRVPGGTLHLKTVLTLAAPGVFVAPDRCGGAARSLAQCAAARPRSAEGRGVLTAVAAALGAAPAAVLVPAAEAAAANCVLVNGALLHRARAEYPRSAALLAAAARGAGLAAAEVEAGELERVDGALTCCSLLVP